MSPNPDFSWNDSVVKDSGELKNSPKTYKECEGLKKKKVGKRFGSVLFSGFGFVLHVFVFILCRGQCRCASVCVKVRGQIARICFLQHVSSRDQAVSLATSAFTH